MTDRLQSASNKLKIILILYKPAEVASETFVSSKKISSISARYFKKFDPNSRSTDLTDKSSDDKNIDISFSEMYDANKQMDDLRKIIDLKKKISEKLEVKMDQLILFTFTQNPKKINDSEDIYEYLSKEDNNPNFPNFFFYSISNSASKINLNIEYHVNNISTISLNLNADCSIYMLKYFIQQNIEGNIPINEQILKVLNISPYNQLSQILREQTNNNNGSCSNDKSAIDRDKDKDKDNSSMFINNASLYYPNSILEKELNDEDTLSDIIKIFSNQDNLCQTKNDIIGDSNTHDNTRLKIVDGSSINFLLFQKSGKRITMGIDFSFNILKDLKKLPFLRDVPAYREASDGLNLLFNCKNPKCIIFEEIFVKNLSFGKFNIKTEIASIRCVKCYSKNVIAINIGFAYCSWKYSGIITNKKSSYVSGDGITMDDSLYIMKEVNILACFTRLEIRVKEIEKKFHSVSSYESEIALGDIVVPIKKNVSNNEKNFERNKSLKGISRVPSIVFQESDERISRVNHNKYEIGYRKKEKVSESLSNSKIEDKDCKLLKDTSNLSNQNILKKDENLISSDNFIGGKNEKDTQEINYEQKKHSECCVNDLSVVKNLKANCVIY